MNSNLSHNKIAIKDEYNLEKKFYIYYEAPNLINSNGQLILGAKERWLTQTHYFLDDLLWLLHLPFHEFWWSIINNSSVINSLVVFLQEAPTPYTLEYFPNDVDLQEYFDKVRQNVLKVFVRLINSKENADCINLKEQSYLFYDQYIFTIPILMDFCQQYGRDNRKMVKEVIYTVFSLQPLYQKDLNKTVNFIIQVLKNIEETFDLKPENQNKQFVSVSDKSRFDLETSLSDFEDTVLYLIDTVSTINIFLDIYLPATTNFKTDYFLTKIVSVYTNTIPKIYKKLDILALETRRIEKYLQLKYFLDATRVEILHIYRKLIYSSIEQFTENKMSGSTVEMENSIEDMFTNLMLISSEKEFITDYNNLYSILDDFHALLKYYPTLDTLKCEFIRNSISTFTDEPNRSSMPAINSSKSFGANSNDPVSNETLQLTNTITGNLSKECYKSEVMFTLISEVKNIFSDLGDGFLEKCLKHYDLNTESVVNALLEKSLPKELKDLDPTLPIIPSDPEEATVAVDVAINVQRLNIYDNDEFDVMTQDIIDTSRVHKGKRKNQYNNINDLFNDKTHLIETRNIYDKYNIISSEYEDEYDDSYDNHDIGLNLQNDDVEVDARPFTTPRILRKKELNIIEDSFELNVINDEMENLTDKDNFIQNPAILRTKIEERRFSQLKHTITQNKSVIGNPKGQGQTKDILDNRSKKNKNKATYANHNRKSGSQWKLNQGMLPS